MDSPISDKWNSGKKIIVYTRRKNKGTSSGNTVSHPNEIISSNSKASVANTDDSAKTDDGSSKIGADDAVLMKHDELSGKEITSIIEGDDSVAAAEKVDLADKMSRISISGDDSLELPEEKQLPNELALDDA